MQKLHPYINIYIKEEEEEVNVSKNDFDDFITWLILDGLKPKKSKRLWVKTILVHLLNDDKMTLENYNDFLESKELRIKHSKKIKEIDTFDYTIILNKTITTSSGKHIIAKITEADSQVHLFFKDGGYLLISKIDIQNSFGK